MNNVFQLCAFVKMDPRLRGNDNGTTWNLRVIPVQVGIQKRAKKLFIITYMQLTYSSYAMEYFYRVAVEVL